MSLNRTGQLHGIFLSLACYWGDIDYSLNVNGELTIEIVIESVNDWHIMNHAASNW